MNDDLARITHITVKKLFKLYNHHVELNLTKRVTIVYGPNGVGKTVLLKLVSDLANGRFFHLSRTPFDLFEIRLSDESGVRVTPELRLIEPSDSDRTMRILSLQLLRSGSVLSTFTFDYDIRPGRSVTARMISAEIPWLDRVDLESWYDDRLSRVLTTSEVVAHYADRLPERVRRELSQEPEWLLSFRKKISVHLVETQRLLKLPNPEGRVGSRIREVAFTVDNYATLLRELISNTLGTYARESQALDQSFPERLIRGQRVALSSIELKRRMQDLANRYSELRRFGLVAENVGLPLPLTALDEIQDYERVVLSLYVDDTEKKLVVLSDIAERILLLIETINKKFRYKKLGVSREAGLVVLGDDGERLALSVLSSGEQHELVLIYDLLFTVQPNSLVMIDEPELSLHLVWQKEFLPDLLRIVEKTGFDVLLATHSPFIIGENTGLLVALASEDG